MVQESIKPKIDFKLNLPTMLKIADLIEKNEKITYTELEDITGLPRPKIENHKKWLVLLGLFNLNNKPTVFGKYRIKLRYDKKEFFSELCHYNLIKNSIIYSVTFLRGLNFFREKNRKKFNIREFKENLIKNCPEWNFLGTHTEKTIDLYFNSIATNEGLPINIIRRIKDEIEYITYKPQEETIFYILNSISLKRKEEKRGGMIIDRDLIYFSKDSLLNIFSSTKRIMDEILGKLQSKGYLTIETSAGLNQIALHTKPTSQEEILQKILEGI